MNYTKEQIEEQVDSLPEVLRVVLFSVETYEVLKSLREKYQLSTKQAEILGSETGLVIMGLVKPSEFGARLKTALGTDDVTANNIAKQIDTEVFSPVKEDLLRLHLEPRVTTVPSSFATTQRGLPPPPPPPIGARRVIPTQSFRPPVTTAQKTNQIPSKPLASVPVGFPTPPPPVPRTSPIRQVPAPSNLPAREAFEPFPAVQTQTKKSPFNTPGINAPLQSAPAPARETFFRQPIKTAPIEADKVSDILSAKLSSSISSENIEHRAGTLEQKKQYSVDPYREPAE